MRICPCDSLLPYVECCAPYHRGTREAPDAFVLKEVDYLWRTLHADHPDRDRPAADVLRELRDACSANRYMGLRVLETQEPDEHGVARVMFAARVFRKGRDLSFVERSEFLHDGEGWRYRYGEVMPL